MWVLYRLAEWIGALDRDPVEPVPIGTFPFSEILDHYQINGRARVFPELVTLLRDLHPRLPLPRLVQERVLADWLPSTFDQEGGDYDSYLAVPMLERLAASGGVVDGGAVLDGDVVLDSQVAMILADLLITEGEALAVDPESPRQRVRTHVALQALARTPAFVPRALGAGERSTWARQPVDRNDPALSARAQWFGQATVDRMPPVIRRAGEISLLPMTPLHDEVMFIRVIQMFELVYRQTFRSIVRAVTALMAGDVEAATVALGDAARRIEGTPSLYRILTTMPRESFAIIRTHTHGRSAIQSRAYREIERICAPKPDGPTEPKIAPVNLTVPTLPEVYASLAAASGESALRGVREVMARLDDGWCSMKRTHWGITLKIIGSVGGTGGTTGATYLKTNSERPLFPMFHGRAGADGDQAEGGRDV
ncbi:MAG: hypothetical protein JWQ95_1965 [Sphaerisporangium sp.]|nr:hypothetical protein [Sphaerisporangium sp.]